MTREQAIDKAVRRKGRRLMTLFRHTHNGEVTEETLRHRQTYGWHNSLRSIRAEFHRIMAEAA